MRTAPTLSPAIGTARPGAPPRFTNPFVTKTLVPSGATSQSFALSMVRFDVAPASAPHFVVEPTER